MRINIDKTHSTKAERIFYELLKKHRIPFRFRETIAGLEIDFIVGKYAIEIDGHKQLVKKNNRLLDLGFIPLHYTNDEVIKGRNEIENKIINKHGIHKS